MTQAKTASKNMSSVFRQCVGYFLLRGDPVRIAYGPLRGWRLPRRIAESHLAMLCGRYDPVLVKQIRAHVGKGDVAYDIGANIGYVSLLLASIVGPTGKVYAFEPAVNEANSLEEVILGNAVQDRVFLQRVAVCDSDGQAVFQETGSTGMLVHLPKALGQKPRMDTRFTVDTVTIDSFVKEQQHAPPDFLKIDVESAEGLVLRGASETVRKFRPRMIVELHGPAAAQQTLTILLEEHGYRCFHVSKRGTFEATTSDQLRDVFTPNVGTCQLLALP